jgi:restriction system protein
MARRKKTSPAEDLIELVALLPWWAGVVLAVLSYVVLHRLASQPLTPAALSGQLDSFLTQSLGRGLANIGQYLLPVLCMAGAAASAWKRKKRNALVADVMQGKASDVLDGMTWREFEMLVAESFRLQGYLVLETGGGGPDGGVDLVIRKGSEKFLVQCKQWRAFKVGVDVVRELYGVMAARGATGGFVVTSGRFSEDAATFASGRNVRLIDGPQLHGRIKQAQAAVKRRVMAPAPGVSAAPAVAMPAGALSLPPNCPVCAKAMARRTAKRGANAGGEFWGCQGYPVCRGTRPIA